MPALTHVLLSCQSKQKDCLHSSNVSKPLRRLAEEATLSSGYLSNQQWFYQVWVSIKHVSIEQLPAVESTTWKGISHNPPSLITLDNQTIIFYYYKEVSIECLCQHWHPPAHSQHRSCSESEPTLDKCASCTGMFLCAHISVYMCIHHICQHFTHLGISLEMSCYVTVLSLRMVDLSNVFSERYDKFRIAATGKIGNHIQDFDTSWQQQEPQSFPWLVRETCH